MMDRLTPFHFVLLLSSQVLLPQFCVAQWTWQNPLPQGNRLGEVQFVDSLHGWIRTQGGTILRTTSGGVIWENEATGAQSPYNWLLRTWFLDQAHGWAVGSVSFFAATSNGGKTWEQRQVPDSLQSSFLSVFFIDSLRGYIGSDFGRIHRTTDGGATWFLNNVFFPRDVMSICFVDSLKGFATLVGALPVPLYITSDGGISWLPDSTIASGTAIRSLDRLHGWMLYNDRVARTVDGGSTWTVHPTQPSSGTNRDFMFIDTLRGWIAGSGGISRTTNGGQTWTRIDSSRPYVGIFFVNDLRGWATGSDAGTVENDFYQTTDGGLTWHARSTAVTRTRLTSVQFIDPMRGWVVGGRELLYTSNAGVAWTHQLQGYSYPLRRLHFINESRGWIATGDTVILRTEDGGNLWQTYSTHSLIGISDIHFPSASVGWGVGGTVFSGGIVLRTIDGGLTWQDRTPPLMGKPSGVFFFDSLRGWVAQGDASELGDNKLYRTVNGGLTWDIQLQEPQDVFSNVHFVDSVYGWLGSDNGFFKTTNGGLAWARTSGPSAGIARMTFVDRLNGWAVGYSGEISHTSDGGETWSIQISSTSNPLDDICFVDRNTGWAVGWFGTILNTANGGVTSVREGATGTSEPLVFRLYNSYPNPFNGATTIRFNTYLPNAPAKLFVYNVLGQVVRILLEQNLEAGQHQVTWDARDSRGRSVSSGLYLFQLRVETTIQVGKMLLIK